MGGSSSTVHHREEDLQARQQAKTATAAAEAAEKSAKKMMESLEKMRGETQTLLVRQLRERQEAENASRAAEEQFRRHHEEASRQHHQEQMEAASRLHQEMLNKLRVEEQARQHEAQRALELEAEQQMRAQEAVEAARRLEEDRVAAEQNLQQELQEERARVHAQKLAQWQQLNRDYPIPDYLKPFIIGVRENAADDVSQELIVNIAVVGDSGTGKSALIKAMLTQYCCLDEANLPKPCFEGDGTRVPTCYAVAGFDCKVFIWDLPGQGTTLFPGRTYLCNMGLKYFDAVMVVMDGRSSQGDLALLQAIRFATIWYVVVRTKIDQAVEDNFFDHGKSQDETFASVRECLAALVDEQDLNRLFLVTTRTKFWEQGLNGAPGCGRVELLCDRIKRHAQQELDRRRWLPPTQLQDGGGGGDAAVLAEVDDVGMAGDDGDVDDDMREPDGEHTIGWVLA